MFIEVQASRCVGELDVVSGKVVWENADLPERVIYAAAPVGVLKTPRIAHWLLLSTVHIALRNGETRIAIDGEVDPALLRGVGYAMAQFGLWYGNEIAEISAPPQTEYALPAAGPRTTAFLSGGVDSLALLVRNHRDFPAGHPLRVSEAVLVDWVGPRTDADLGGAVSGQHAHLKSVLDQVSETLEVTVVPLVTNVRRLARNDFYYDWMFQDHGGALAGLAHLLDGRTSTAFIASTYDLATMGPWGSHPLIDPWYSSSGVRILHDSPDQGRLEKLRLLVTRPRLLQVLNVCSYWFQRTPADRLNCGRCEKCLRTVVGLAALGVGVADLPTFVATDPVAGTDELARFNDDYERACWAELADPLAARGEVRLAAAVRRLLDRATVVNPFTGPPVTAAAGRS